MTGYGTLHRFRPGCCGGTGSAGMIREYAQVAQGGSVSGTCKLDDEPRLGTELDVR